MPRLKCHWLLFMCSALLTTLSAQTWAPLKTWAGTSSISTESVTPTSREWRLTWRIAPTNQERNAGLLIIVKKASDDSPAAIVKTAADPSGVSYVRSAGAHYLDITAVNATWTITAEHQGR
jgi:hypothetical protein